MAVDITTYTNQITSALYGNQVRSSIVNALLACAAAAGITIQGTYASLAALQAAHPTGNTGDYYIAGYVLYYWNGSAWTNAGQILPNIKTVQNANGSVTVTTVDQTGTTSATISPSPYILPAATASALGGIKVGSNLTIQSDGTLSGSAPTPAYVLPNATSSVLGGVKIGDGINVSAGTISQSSTIYHYYGEVPAIDSTTLVQASYMTLYGNLVVTVHANLCRIEAEITPTANTGTSSNFALIQFASIINSLTGKTFTPVENGGYWLIDRNGASSDLATLYGYAPTLGLNNGMIQLARIYNTSGASGGWPASQGCFSTSNMVKIVCMGYLA